MISLFHLGTHNLSQCQFVNLFGNFSLLCGLTVPGGLKNPLKNKLFTIILANSAHATTYLEKRQMSRVFLQPVHCCLQDKP